MRFAGPGKVVLWGVAIVLAAAVLFFAGNRARNDDPPILQSYEVPQEIAAELRSTLATALWRGNDQPALGQIALMPNGQLLVTAPVSVQSGVRRIIREIAESKPVATPTIGFDVWIVTAVPGGDGKVSAALGEIEPALAVIRKTKGPLAFDLVEKLSTVTRAGLSESKVRGATAGLEVQASLRKAEDNQQVVAAKLKLAINATQTQILTGTMRQLEAQIELRPGELLVVGQSAAGAVRDDAKADAQVYYIARATL
jgi:hypothetical protein